MRSRPFVVSTMGSVTAHHCNVSFYACYHKLYLHTFVVSTMGSVPAHHYNVSFYACNHELYLHCYYGFFTVLLLLVLIAYDSMNGVPQLGAMNQSFIWSEKKSSTFSGQVSEKVSQEGWYPKRVGIQRGVTNGIPLSQKNNL